MKRAQVRRWFRLVVLFVALVGVAASLVAPRLQAKIRVGNYPKEAVAKHVLRMRDGRQYSLAGLRGQVVVLDFIAVWCAHSREHVPTLTRFDEEDGERGLKVIGLMVLDRETHEARVSQFIKDQQINYPIGMITYEEFERYVESKKDTDVPQTLIFGRDGRLAAHFAGHNQQIDAAIHQVVQQELKKPR